VAPADDVSTRCNGCDHPFSTHRSDGPGFRYCSGFAGNCGCVGYEPVSLSEVPEQKVYVGLEGAVLRELQRLHSIADWAREDSDVLVCLNRIMDLVRQEPKP
jgi:hypothetical protein